MEFKFDQQEKLVQQIAEKQQEIVSLQDLLNAYTRIQDAACNAIASTKSAFDLLKESGVDQDSFVAWQEAVIEAAGVENAIAVDPQTDVEAIEILQKENASLIAKIEKMEQAALISAQKINELKEKVVGDCADEIVENIDAIEVVDAIARVESMSYFNKGDIVQMEDGRVCTVVYDPGEGEIVHLRLPDKSSGNFHRSQLKLISTAPTDNADSAIAPSPSDDELISELIKQNPLSWQEIQIFCKGDVAKLRLIQNHKKSKKLAKEMAGMYENYLIDTGDISDKSWLPQDFIDLLSDGVPF